MATLEEVFVGNKFITNPVIINIGVSQYIKYKDLDCCQYDVDNMNKLWSEKYGFKNIFSNSNKLYNSTDNNSYNDEQKDNSDDMDDFIEINHEPGSVTFGDFKNILEAAQTKIFTDTTIDSLILSFSGHGDEDSIYLSDSERYNAYKIQDIISFFSGNGVPSRFANCPKIIILDKCRGNQITKLIQHNKRNQSKGDNNTVLYHPGQEFAVLYSNTDGYVSWDSHKGGYLIRAICDILGNDKYISQKLEFCALVKMIRNRAMILSEVELHKNNINTMQCIELHDTLTHNVYFGKHKVNELYNNKLQTTQQLLHQCVAKNSEIENNYNCVLNEVAALKVHISEKDEIIDEIQKQLKELMNENKALKLVNNANTTQIINDGKKGNKSWWG